MVVPVSGRPPVAVIKDWTHGPKFAEIFSQPHRRNHMPKVPFKNDMEANNANPATG
jgi:hypothetical protein